MTRVFALGIALALAIAILPAASPSADAADKGKSPKKGGFTPDEAATMTAIALAEFKEEERAEGEGRAEGGEWKRHLAMDGDAWWVWRSLS